VSAHYVVHGELDRGGMATIRLGVRVGDDGRRVPVVIKALHAHLADLEDLRARFVDETRILTHVRHRNVVRTLDVLETGGELLLVLEYVHGASLSELFREEQRAGRRIPLPVVSSVLSGALAGLHAAHEARAPDGTHLGIVHRDVTPRNLMVGVDGVARVLDFGIARATVRTAPETSTGAMRGTPTYMAPEQVRGSRVSPRTDVFIAGVVLWELVAGQRISAGCDNEAQFLLKLVEGKLPRAADMPKVPAAVAKVIDRAIALDPEDRFASADEMARALRVVQPPAVEAAVASWVRSHAGEKFKKREAMLSAALGHAADRKPEDSVTAKRLVGEEEGTVTTLALGTQSRPWAPSNASTQDAMTMPVGAPPRRLFGSDPPPRPVFAPVESPSSLAITSLRRSDPTVELPLDSGLGSTERMHASNVDSGPYPQMGSGDSGPRPQMGSGDSGARLQMGSGDSGARSPGGSLSGLAAPAHATAPVTPAYATPPITPTNAYLLPSPTPPLARPSPAPARTAERNRQIALAALLALVSGGAAAAVVLAMPAAPTASGSPEEGQSSAPAGASAAPGPGGSAALPGASAQTGRDSPLPSSAPPTASSTVLSGAAALAPSTALPGAAAPATPGAVSGGPASPPAAQGSSKSTAAPRPTHAAAPCTYVDSRGIKRIRPGCSGQ
jgi:serine/threonine-protein kinase